ncbi:5'-methylthioadenosine/S-adenosylhomocysteine nucleosidase [Bacillus sp. SB49]|uniref:5'-methylthioadenosine/S-adenosylhomocysteine nucleosidase n=1 Tax=Bacillaceae TaxID=186817 RepID=UPI0002A4F19C|nr:MULTISPECIES: 5'-methylthioadenosine/S-adenosylhomocysteine nucleosidase [Bacillaceae]ELK45533.1 5'-methylthioadenosine/ S-adenosylhomocysteinenucleosidase [Halobacillus sp. BAB-2008]QHT47239.1 5'-methylthioadenosine/S-adenosylhomocysteine nucleosidase [Bacillus sp. SB49]
MTIGIIGAMDEEIERLQSEMEVTAEKEVAGSKYIEGTLYDVPVVLLLSGIGKVNAAVSATILHEQYEIDAVINTGSAGGFAKELEVGDVVVSTSVTHHDVDVTAFDYAYGQVPGMPAMFDADEQLMEKAMEAIAKTDARAAKGIIATGDSFMQDPVRVDFVRGKFPDMIAAEMEAAAIAQVCHKYGTPFVVIRALSDIAGKESSISFDEFLPKAAENAAQMIMTMIQSYK